MGTRILRILRIGIDFLVALRPLFLTVIFFDFYDIHDLNREQPQGKRIKIALK